MADEPDQRSRRVLRPSSPSGGRPAAGETEPGPQRPRVRWWLLALLALLVVNYWAGSHAMQAHSRVRIPFSPFFVHEVDTGNVGAITSRGTAIQGTFKQATSYGGSKPTSRFKTEIPSFADTKALSQLLQRKGVVVNAQPLDKGGSWWANLLLGFGPTILFVGLLFWLMRRAGGTSKARGGFGRASGRPPQPGGERGAVA